MKPTSYIEISRKNLKSNLAFIQKILGKKCQLSSVVKGNAYGHGIEEFTPLLLELGVSNFAVYSAFEAEKVKNACGDQVQIMIMGSLTNEEIEWAITNKISFFVFNLEKLYFIEASARKVGEKAKIHIEIETGLNRTGFEKHEFLEALDFINHHQTQFDVCGLCSHLSGAESIANYKRIKTQIKRFKHADKVLQDLNFPNLKRHLACSAATIMYPETKLDLARVGIMQFGFWPSKEVQIYYLGVKKLVEDPLKRLLTWKTYVSSVKQVKAGEFIGYGNAVLAEKNMKIASIPVGYANGYSRSLSNMGKVLIHGKRLDVIGFVNMNTTMIDASNLENVAINDEVVLIGEQEGLNISVASFSEMSNLLNYEMLARLPDYIPKYIID